MRNSFELALDHHGRKLGGLPVEVIYEDDQIKPEVGVQKAQKLIESDKVDFLVGYHLVERAARLAQADHRFQDLHHHHQRRRLAARRRAVLAVRVLDLLEQRPDAAGDRPLHEPEERQDGVPDRPELRRRQGHAGRRGSDLQGQDHRPRADRAGRPSSTSRPSCRRRATPSPTRSSRSIRAAPASSSSPNTRSPASRARSRSTPRSPSTRCRCRG